MAGDIPSGETRGCRRPQWLRFGTNEPCEAKLFRYNALREAARFHARRLPSHAMTLEPLVHAPLVVQAHVATVVPAFLLAAWLLVFSRKGLRWHRAMGGLFLALMVTTAIITLFIHRRLPGSPVFGMSSTHLFVHLFCLRPGVRLMDR
jgi:uncharacterized membrane protein